MTNSPSFFTTVGLKIPADSKPSPWGERMGVGETRVHSPKGSANAAAKTPHAMKKVARINELPIARSAKAEQRFIFSPADTRDRGVPAELYPDGRGNVGGKCGRQTGIRGADFLIGCIQYVNCTSRLTWLSYLPCGCVALSGKTTN